MYFIKLCNINFHEKNFIVLLFFLNSDAPFGSKPPVKWGKVEEADLQMTSYAPDAEADAVVLTDYASIDLSFEGSTSYTMFHHVRIKVLKTSAFDRGDISIDYYSFDKLEEIKNLKAQVILPDGEKVKLKNKDFFNEEINKYWTRKKFAMPSLKEGAVLEYSYTKKSGDFFTLANWYFQRDIPTRHSELRVNIPEWMDYISFAQGDVPVHESNIAQQTFRFDNGRNSAERTQKGSASAKVDQRRYIMTDVPALKQERFMTTMKDYYAKINLQLQSVQFPGGLFQPFNSSWQQVAEKLRKRSSFGEQIYKTRNTKKLMSALEPLVADLTDPYKKVIMIYNFLSATVEWNELYSISVRESLDDAFERKLATAGERNLMLIAACHHLGIETYPVLISTRSHGKMLELYPKADQFNHVLAFVKTGDKEQLLDVGSEHRSPAYLRVNSLNYRGWLVDGPQSQWINVTVPPDSETMVIDATLSADGTLSGKVQEICAGYSAMQNRNNYYKNKDKDQVHISKEWQKTFPDATIKNIKFDNPAKAAAPLKSAFEINLTEAAQINGDFIYLSPLLGNGYTENPLKLKDRTFPVDMPYQIKEQYIFNLTIPEGYMIEEIPEPAKVNIANNAGNFRFITSEKDGKIQINSKIYIKQTRYQPEEYQSIRQFFDLIVEKHGEQIVLKKAM